MRWSVITLALALATHSQAAPLPVPNAGQLLKGRQMLAQPEPAPLKTESLLRIIPPAELSLPPSVVLEVKAFEISGNTVFDTPTLQALLAPALGQSLTVAQLNQVVSAIGAYYRQAGYSMARAYVPKQGLQEGVVRIEVLEPHLGAVRMENRSAVDSDMLEPTLAGLPRDLVLRDADVEGLALRLSDMLGTHPSVVLQAGPTPGSADVLVQVDPGDSAQASVTLDNDGNRFTGRERVGADLQWFNPLHRGDVLALAALTTGSNLTTGRLSYETPLGGWGASVGADISTLQYTLGDTAASLQAHGSASQGGVWMRKSLLRSRDTKLSAGLQYDSLQLRDDVDAVVNASQSDRSLSMWTARAQLDTRDTLLGGGANVAGVALHSGTVGFDNAASALLDAQTARTAGDFSYWELSLARTQSLAPDTSLVMRYNNQQAQGNLDASQKFSLGGMRNVRAYESDLLSGDSGQSLSLEVRQNLPWLAAGADGGQWQALMFWDAAQLHVSQKVWNTGANVVDMSGVGVGLSWRGPQGLHARLTYATALGNTPIQLQGTQATHESVWLELGADF